MAAPYRLCKRCGEFFYPSVKGEKQCAQCRAKQRKARKNPSKRKVRRRVAKALRKYVRGNPSDPVIRMQSFAGIIRAVYLDRRGREYVIIDGKKRYLNLMNPSRVKGRKTKGGRAVTLKNFTGTIVKKSDGTVQIVGRGRRK